MKMFWVLVTGSNGGEDQLTGLVRYDGGDKFMTIIRRIASHAAARISPASTSSVDSVSQDMLPEISTTINPTAALSKAIALFNVGWDQIASSAGPPSGNVENSWWAGAAKRCWSHPTSFTDPTSR